MIKSCLEPTYENLIRTIKEDSLGRNYDILSLVRFLQGIDEGVSLAIEGEWGSGKTFFIKQAKLFLDALNPYTQMETDLNDNDKDYLVERWEKFDGSKTELINHICVYFDAWDFDCDSDPLESLIYQISKSASLGYRFQSERNYLEIGAAAFNLIKGKNISELLNALKSDDITKNVEKQKDLKAGINEYLNALLPEQGERLVIFVDELDRCNPKYAVKLLERIKHYFNNEKITFIFSVNINQLQYTVKQIYGNDFDGYNYLDRFFDIRLPMPALDMQKLYQASNIKLGASSPKHITDFMARKYNMQIRTILHCHDYINSLYEDMISLNDFYEAKQFCYYIIVPILICLRHISNRYYNEFFSGKNPDLLVDVIFHDKKLKEVIYFKYFTNSYSNEDDSDEMYKEKIIKVYNAIFNEDFSSIDGNGVGSMYLRDDLKTYIKCTLNTVSNINRRI